MNIGITIGDAAGIGPEVILKALQRPFDSKDVRPVIFGSAQVLEHEDRRLEERVPGYQPVRDRFDVQPTLDHVDADALTIVDVGLSLNFREVPTGNHDRRCATLQLEAFIAAINAAEQRKIEAIVTAPLNKDLFRTIGKPVIGHTEILATHFNAPQSVMMLAGPRLRVALVTTHEALRDVPSLITGEDIQTTIRTTVDDLKRFYGIEAPRIAVCGLNPHAGEAGAMGDEEIEIIAPALRQLRMELGSQIEITGPYPADTLFARFARGPVPFDVVICMYHDQGLIPLKLLHFGESANITLGLPIVRTSVDHGTAYNIAGKGVADAGSMRYAMELAIKMARRVNGGSPAVMHG
ncbi:MAG: 4-hydroxythreonine-4-phosphate dehydrogenase PdxA [Bradymonadaceae bacterium]